MQRSVPLTGSKAYILEPRTQVWHRRDAEYNFHYSDGDDAEGRIARCIRESEDVSAGSVELCRGISDWPTLYH